MADTDAALYTLRYNQVSQALEGQGGTPSWNALTLNNPDPVAGITRLTGDVTAGPGSGSVAATVALVGGVAASIIAGAIPSAAALMVSSNSVDPTLTFTANANTSIIYQEHAGNHNLVLQNGVGGGITISRAAGSITLNGLSLLGGSNPIRTNSDINAGSQSGDVSAILVATSTTRGFLPPRMTTVQRDAIATPAEGLHVYNTTDHADDYYNGSSWGPVGSGSSITVTHITVDTSLVNPGLYWTDNPSTAVTFTLPNAATVTGKTFSFNTVQSGAANLIATVSNQTIDGVDATGAPIPAGVQSYVSDGSNWFGISVA